MIYILIIIACWSGCGVGQVEFSSLEACQSARMEMSKRAGMLFSASTICVQKGNGQ